MVTYPKTLPLPQKDGYGINQKGGIIKTQMTSGLARHRMISANPPTEIPVKWRFTRADFGIFEAWYLYEAKTSVAWFDIELLSGLGLVLHKARFTDDGYKSTLNSQSNMFEVSATLEVLNRPTLSEGSLRLLLNYGIEDLTQTGELIATTTGDFFNKI